MEVTYRCFGSKRNFGIELEIEKTRTQQQIQETIQTVSKKPIQTTGGSWAQSNNNMFWHVKYDSTCGPLGKGKDNGGWEIASFVASGYKDLLEIEAVTNALRESGCKVNKNCGLHIHADASDFSRDQISALTAYWIKVEGWLSQAVPANRVNNKYCKLISKVKKLKFEDSYDPVKLWNVVKPTNFSIHENDQKKMALNLVGVAQKFHYDEAGTSFPMEMRQTIELRMPEGTLDGNEVKNWVRLFLLFVETCKDKEMPSNLKPASTIEELLCVLGLADSDKFYLLSKGLHETKTWLLKRVTSYGTHKGKREATGKLKFISV